MFARAIIAAVASVGFTCASAACFDLSKGQPASLEGHLRFTILPGPPNYEDVQKGDTPESVYILYLAKPICLTGDEFADPNTRFSAVQLVPTKPVERAMKGLVGTDVRVQLGSQMAAETGHHHEPLVASVTSIHAINDEPLPDAFISEYGTAGTVVRAFYYALEQGSGETAARYIVPEKRTLPAFSAKELSNFYGSLSQPIRLISIRPSISGGFLVHYVFKSQTGRCDGSAIVSTEARAGRNYISGIKALNGC